MKIPLLAIVFALAGPGFSLVRAQTYERIDVNDQGAPGTPPTSGGVMSDDARFVVFASNATNLGGVDVPGGPDLFLRDRTSATTVRVPMGTGTGALAELKISGNGQRIFFQRNGQNGQSPRTTYVYDRPTNVFREILVPGTPFMRLANVNFDGRFAAVHSRATVNDPELAYRLDVDADALLLCSRDIDGNPVGGLAMDIDDDGTHLLIESSANQIVAGDTNGTTDAYLYDIPGNVYLRVAEAQSGGQPGSAVSAQSLSGNGRYVTFASRATNLDASPAGAVQTSRVYVRDVRLETTALAYAPTAQVPTDEISNASLTSSDGSTVASGSFLIFSFFSDVRVKDIENGVEISVTPGSGGMATLCGISADGRNILFGSTGEAIPGQTTTSGLWLAKFGPRCSSSNYCSSLPNSTGAAATIGAQGDASRTLNNFVISAVGLPDTANAMIVSGTSAVDPGTPFGNGLMCIGGALIRHGIHVANGGVIIDAQDMQSAEYAGVNPGDTRYYQVVYRDPPAGGALFNTTDAVSVTFCW